VPFPPGDSSERQKKGLQRSLFKKKSFSDYEVIYVYKKNTRKHKQRGK
jgi:hypothetical protein